MFFSIRLTFVIILLIAVVIALIYGFVGGLWWAVRDYLRDRAKNKRRRLCRCPACDHDLNSVHVDQRNCPNCGTDVRDILENR